MPVKTALKSRILDDKDKKILNDKIYIHEAEDLAENTVAMANLVRKFGKQNWMYDYSSN